MKCQYIFRNFDKINLIYRSFISAGTPLGSNVANGSAGFRQHSPNTAPSVPFPMRVPASKTRFLNNSRNAGRPALLYDANPHQGYTREW